MSLRYETTIDNSTIVQLEREDQIKNVLTENRSVTVSEEVRDIVRHAALAQIIS